MDHPKLNHPPVLEAIIGILILNNEYWADYYKAVVELINSDYTVVNERVSFRVKNKVPPFEEDYENVNDTQIIKDGYILSNPGVRKTVLLKPDSIQIIKKAPYIEWDDLFADFRNVIDALNSVAPSLVFVKPYVKYRNGFPIPVEADESMGEHFSIIHSVPSLLTKFAITNMSFAVDMVDGPFTCKIEQRLKPSEKLASAIDVIVNIDVTNNVLRTNNTAEILGSIENLRTKKNQIFFGILTEKTLQLFS